MTRKHLEIFCMVCRERSMTGAAEKLHMTQPAVSRAVAELEAGYGVRLFDRVGKKLLLTAKGEKLWEDAEGVLSGFARFESHAAEADRRAVLEVGCSLGIGYARMRGWLETYSETCPGVEVRVRENYTASIQEMILGGELDFAVVEGRITNRGIRTEGCFEDEILILASPDHPLAKKEKVTFAEVAAQTLLLPERVTDTRSVIDHLADIYGLTLTPAWTGLNMAGLASMAASGLGITMLSRHWAERELSEGKLVALRSDLPLKRRCSIACLRHRHLPPEAERFLEIVRRG